MKSRPPVLGHTGYRLDEEQLWLLQREGWIALQLVTIRGVKSSSLTELIVRLAGGGKKTISLSHLSPNGFSAVTKTLREAVRLNRAPKAK
jgi:hypothetical protein